MQTYKYQFPAYGSLVTDMDADAFRQALEYQLNEGPDCLQSYAMFPSDSAILERVTIDMDERHAVSAINLHTYTKLWEGHENDLRKCLETNILEHMDEFAEYDIGAFVEGDVQFLGREGNMPGTLYHVTEKENVDHALENGLLPEDMRTGKIYLCEDKDLATWLAVLKKVENPAVIEVNTEGLDIETVRAYNDREFVGRNYVEYITESPISKETLSEAKITRGNELGTRIAGDMESHLANAEEDRELAEVRTGLNRLEGMGLMTRARIDAIVETHMKIVAEGRKDVDEDDLNDFARAVNGIDSPKGQEL